MELAPNAIFSGYHPAGDPLEIIGPPGYHPWVIAQSPADESMMMHDQWHDQWLITHASPVVHRLVNQGQSRGDRRASTYI